VPEIPHVALTCWSTLGARAHSPHLSLTVRVFGWLVLLAGTLLIERLAGMRLIGASLARRKLSWPQRTI
jgi:hypothetical protein